MENELNTIERLKNAYHDVTEKANILFGARVRISKGGLRRLFAGVEAKKEHKLKRDSITRQYKEKEKEASDLFSRISEVSRFDFVKAQQFLAQVISIIEDEPYEAVNFNTRCNTNMFSTALFDMEFVLNGTIKEHGLIARPQAIKTIQSNVSYSEYWFGIYIRDEKETERFALVDCDSSTDDRQPLLNPQTVTVMREFKGPFPYLEDVILDLVDTRLSNPQMSEDELFGVSLQKVSENAEAIRGKALQKGFNGNQS